MIRPKNSNGKGHWPAEESGEPEAKLGGATTANKKLIEKHLKFPKRSPFAFAWKICGIPGAI